LSLARSAKAGEDSSNAAAAKIADFRLRMIGCLSD
jgi:hypothetical protein